MKSSASIELLESRIAPAAVYSFIDVDGDKVTVTSSKGASFDLMNAASVVGGQLQTLDLSSATFGGEFAHASITITAVHQASGAGDGRVNVGYINATGIDLEAVKIGGDLGRIDVGDSNFATPGLASLHAGSIYRFGLSTQDANGTETSKVQGGLGSLATTGDLLGSLLVVGGPAGRIGSIVIGGSLKADPSIPNSHGYITTEGDIGPLAVKGSFLGGQFDSDGGAVIQAGGKIASLTVGGSMFGYYTTSGSSAGVVAEGDIGPVKIAHDMHGATAGGSDEGAFIRSHSGKIASVFVGGSLIGGTDSKGGEIYGKTGVGNVKITGEVLDGSVVSGAAMDSVSIGGSLTGGNGPDSGLIRSATSMGAVVIGGDIVGGNFDAGRVDAGVIASVTVHGSVRGGAAIFSGVISANSHLGPVRVGHDLVGGDDVYSGVIISSGGLSSVTVAGSVLGGTADFTGIIAAGSDLGAVKIGGDLKANFVLNSAAVTAGGKIASVFIGGSDSTIGVNIIARGGSSSGSIRSGSTIGSIVVKGGMSGSAYGPAIFSAASKIKSVSIGGSMTYGEILAGYDSNLAAVNADAQIGPVSIGGDFTASSVVAGGRNLGADNAAGGSGLNADNVNFGDSHDGSIGGGLAGILSKIASITIGGNVLGTLNTLNISDSFGLVAEQIGAVKIGGLPLVLAAGAHNDNLTLGPTADVHIHEI